MPRILLLEDDSALNKVICRTLEIEGYEADCATTAEEALGKLINLPDVIILDLLLQGLDGSTFFTEAIERGFRGRLIVISGHDEAPSMARWMSADAFLAKPFDPERLLRLLKGFAVGA